MKRTLAVFLLVSLASARGRGDTPSPRTLRVLTYNIHHGQGTDGVFDLPRIAGIVKDAHADLVALQEVDEHTSRSGGVNQLDELERLTGMHATFGKTMDYSGGEYGVAVLSRWPFLNTDNEPMPSSSDREPRTALTVRIRPGDAGPIVQFTCTHFDQSRDEQDRLSQAEFVNAREVHGDVPAILAGDMNARPETEVIKTLEAEWTDASPDDQPTSPAARPRFRSDYVLFRPAGAWKVIESTVIDDRIASDHRPVLAVLEWTGTP